MMEQMEFSLAKSSFMEIAIVDLHIMVLFQDVQLAQIDFIVLYAKKKYHLQ